MPVAEAMSMGRPAIVTNWSGLADFVDEDVGYPVSYKLKRVGWMHAEKESTHFRRTFGSTVVSIIHQVPSDVDFNWFARNNNSWAEADVPHLRRVR